MSHLPGRPKEGSLPLGGKARSAKGAPISPSDKLPGAAPAPTSAPAQGVPPPEGARERAPKSDPDRGRGERDGGNPGYGQPARARQEEQKGLDRRRLEPQDHPPAKVLDEQNIAGERDFELRPPASK